MKKILSILMVLIMAGTVSACGGNQESTEPPTAESTTVEAESTEESTTEEKSKEPTEVELVDYGYTLSQESENAVVLYAVKIKNPNERYAINYPVITITARDVDNKILSTEDMTLSCISAGDTIIYANKMYYEGNLPETVEISAGNRDDNYTLQLLSDAIYQEDIVIENTSENIGERKRTYTGEITNNSDTDMDAAISIVFTKEGKLLGGTTSYVDDIGAGETKAFEVSSTKTISDYDAYEIHAIQW